MIGFNENDYKNAKNKLKEMFDINIEEFPINVQNGLIDVEINHNRSWIKDLYEKNKNSLHKTALLYRGKKISYAEMFENVEIFADRLEKMGVKKGTEVPVFMTPCPEFIYVIMAINLLEAKINSFGNFDKGYITEILNSCDTYFVVCTDDNYDKITGSINNSKICKTIMFSLTDSLINGVDPYIEIDKDFYDFKNKVPYYKTINKNIISKDEFIGNINNVNKTIEEYENGNIDDEFLITYSSGTSNSSRPKPIVHRNRSLITMGRFHERDLSELPPTEDLIGEMIIPTFSNTSIITSMSDVLYKRCTVAIEPIYKREFLLYSLAINKPNFIAVPRNMLVDAAKKIYSDPKFKNFKMPYMMMLTSVGEPTSKGEEKFINKMLRKAKCGIDKLPRPLAPVPISIGGGDCERGGMFFTPYRSLQDLIPKYSLTNSRCNLKKYAMVQAAVLDEDNCVLPYGKVGRLVVKTPTAMKCYKNNLEATEKSFITDSKGNVWCDCKTYACIEKHGTIDILGRMGNELILDDREKFPLYKIGNEVEKDTKNILSYEVVNVDNNIVVHIEFQPESTKSKQKVIMGIEKRILKKYGESISKKISYRVRSFEEGFVGTKSEKRNHQILVEEGITSKCVKPILIDGVIELQPIVKEKVKVLK